MLEESEVYREALRSFIKETAPGHDFDPKFYANQLKVEGYLNYFPHKLLSVYEQLSERQRIFIEWFPESRKNGMNFLQKLMRSRNFSLGADFLQACLLDAETKICKRIFENFQKNCDLPSDNNEIAGQLLTLEVITRGDYDLLRADSGAEKLFDVLSAHGLHGLRGLTAVCHMKNMTKQYEFLHEFSRKFGAVTEENSETKETESNKENTTGSESSGSGSYSTSNPSSSLGTRDSAGPAAHSKELIGSFADDSGIESSWTESDIQIHASHNGTPMSNASAESRAASFSRQAAFAKESRKSSKAATSASRREPETMELISFDTDSNGAASRSSSNQTDRSHWAFLPVKYTTPSPETLVFTT